MSGGDDATLRERGLTARCDSLYAGLVAALQATHAYDPAEPDGYDVTPERVVEAVAALRAERDAAIGRAHRAETARDDAADAYDILVRRVWEAATGDTHEGPASVEVLLDAVAGLRARADGAEAARDALRAAAQEYLVTVTGCAAAGELLNDAQAVYECAVDQVRAEPGSSSLRTEVAHVAVRLSAAGLAYIDADLTRDAARERLRTLAGEG